MNKEIDTSKPSKGTSAWPCAGWNLRSTVFAKVEACCSGHHAGRSPCSFGLSATSQQYFSLRTNQYQPSATSRTNRLDSRGGRARSGMQGGSHSRCGLSGRQPRSMLMGEVEALWSMRTGEVAATTTADGRGSWADAVDADGRFGGGGRRRVEGWCGGCADADEDGVWGWQRQRQRGLERMGIRFQGWRRMDRVSDCRFHVTRNRSKSICTGDGIPLLEETDAVFASAAVVLEDDAKKALSPISFISRGWRRLLHPPPAPPCAAAARPRPPNGFARTAQSRGGVLHDDEVLMSAVAAAVTEELVEHHLAAVSLYLAGCCRGRGSARKGPATGLLLARGLAWISPWPRPRDRRRSPSSPPPLQRPAVAPQRRLRHHRSPPPRREKRRPPQPS
jgi:hypothetical protein